MSPFLFLIFFWAKSYNILVKNLKNYKIPQLSQKMLNNSQTLNLTGV